MYGKNPRSTAAIGGHPLHPMIIPLPITCFIATFVCDIVYVSNHVDAWAIASNWLLGAGLGTAVLAAATGLTDYMGDDRIRRLGTALQHMLANVAAVVLELVNLVLRLSDQNKIESVGIFLSGATVLVLAYSGWLGGELVYRHRVGVQETPDEFSGYDGTDRQRS